MNRDEALQMLRGGREGIEAWNRKRSHKESVPELTNVELSQVDLRGADLSGMNLRGSRLERSLLSAPRPNDSARGEARTSLRRANLSQTCFENADLRYADLAEANFDNADLSGAYLNGADLRGSTFRKANLISTHFHDADLSGANLSDAHLVRVEMRGARLQKASLCFAQMTEADFRKADLSAANLSKSNLHKANFTGADLRGAILVEANLTDAVATHANLRGSWMQGALLVRTDFRSADLSGSSIYGISAWDVQIEAALQADLIVSPPSQPTVTVDQIEVAQFIYLLLNNRNIRRVIDTITSKVVLILGRFTTARKAVLDTLRDDLRKRDHLPIVFDFDKPVTRDLTETISTLAHMARFIVADLTDAKSLPQELQAIVPNLPSVPVQPILEESSTEYAMFEHLRRYPWVLPIRRYRTAEHLESSFANDIVAPAVARAKELRPY